MKNRAVVISAVVVVVAFAAWFVFMPRVDPPTTREAGARVEPEAAPLPPPSVVSVEPRPTATMPEAAVATAPAAPDVAVVPEALPELDAFAKNPPEWDRWTADQRQDYRDGLFEKVARREAQLEREIAADAANKDMKLATLELLRSRRDQLLANNRTRPPRNDAEP